jgi:DNA excision repair protein ERCC-3
MSFHQWSNEFKKWSDLRDEDIAVSSAAEKRRFNGEAGVLITTYSMITTDSKRAYDTQQMMEWIHGKEWGLISLDEVHVVPAKMFRKVDENIRAHCKLGLTATLLCEGDKIMGSQFRHWTAAKE